MRLASVGIFLDEDAKYEAPKPPKPPEIDRGLIRAILIDAGAPAHALDWLTASCISVEAALTYRPPSENT